MMHGLTDLKFVTLKTSPSVFENYFPFSKLAFTVKVEVKVKVTPERDTKAQRGSR
jgi:hypothetical protein